MKAAPVKSSLRRSCLWLLPPPRFQRTLMRDGSGAGGDRPAGWDQAWAYPRGAGVDKVGTGITFIVQLTMGTAAFGRFFFGQRRRRAWRGNIIRCAERVERRVDVRPACPTNQVLSSKLVSL